MRLTLVTPPLTEPVALGEMKDFLRIEGTENDSVLLALIAASRQYVEQATHRALIHQTYDYKLNRFPMNRYGCGLRLPRPPLASVVSVTYTDPDGDLQTLSPSGYVVDTSDDHAGGLIIPAYDEVWPDVRDFENVVTVRFIAGYGPNREDVPESIRQAIKLLVGHWYENREPQLVGIGATTMAIPFTLDSLILMNRAYTVI